MSERNEQNHMDPISQPGLTKHAGNEDALDTLDAFDTSDAAPDVHDVDNRSDADADGGSILACETTRRYKVALMFFRRGAMTLEEAMGKAGPWYNFAKKCEFRKELKRLVEGGVLLLETGCEPGVERYALTTRAMQEFESRVEEEAGSEDPRKGPAKVLPPFRPPFRPLQKKNIPSLLARRHDAVPVEDRPRYSTGISMSPFNSRDD